MTSFLQQHRGETNKNSINSFAGKAKPKATIIQRVITKADAAVIEIVCNATQKLERNAKSHKMMKITVQTSMMMGPETV